MVFLPYKMLNNIMTEPCLARNFWEVYVPERWHKASIPTASKHEFAFAQSTKLDILCPNMPNSVSSGFYYLLNREQT